MHSYFEQLLCHKMKCFDIIVKNEWEPKVWVAISTYRNFGNEATKFS